MTDGPTGSRRRWWEGGERSVEAEASWFAEEGLDFRLDQELFDNHDVVVFRGELCLGDQTTPASVYYPPAYGVGGHPAVVASELRLGRHQDPSGALCLDHPVFGETVPMYGAEAALRAQRLWDLWENDRAQLEREEADAPDPRANYFEYESDSAVALIDVDVSGFDAGFIRLGALELKPFRAGVAQVRTSEPRESTLDPAPGLGSFVGPYEINGVWVRVPEPPPPTHAELEPWVKEHHARRVEELIRLTAAARQVYKKPDLPAVIAFVYPDEGPRRGQIHDAWLFLIIHQDGKGQMARAFHLRSDERWLRQPQLQPLEEKRLAVVGTGALGSPLVDLLAKAGVGNLLLLDHDISTIGNRVRHQLDLTDLGRNKVQAMANRVLRVNPWANVEVQGTRLGAAMHGLHEEKIQEVHDTLIGEFEACDIIVNATAHTVTGHYCSQIGQETNTPVLHTWVGAGAWAARILLQRPGQSGCTECLGLSQQPETTPQGVEIPCVERDPDAQEVMERGCADPTFTGPGFELVATAAATRVTVQVLLDGDGYPPPDFDLVTLKLPQRDDGEVSGLLQPLARSPRLLYLQWTRMNPRPYGCTRPSSVAFSRSRHAPGRSVAGYSVIGRLTRGTSSSLTPLRLDLMAGRGGYGSAARDIASASTRRGPHQLEMSRFSATGIATRRARRDRAGATEPR